MSAKILKRQSTYWDILTAAGMTRIHFLGKEEFHFVSADIEGYVIVDDHYLLLDYSSTWCDLYVSTSTDKPSDVLNAIIKQWTLHYFHWRSPYRYLNEGDPENILSTGFGQLLSAPEPLAIAACEVLRLANLEFTLLRGAPARGSRKVLLASGNYVIAKDFREEHRAA